MSRMMYCLLLSAGVGTLLNAEEESERTPQHVAAAFERAATSTFERILERKPAIRKQLAGMYETTEDAIARKLGKKFMEAAGAALRVSDEEARTILSGKLDDAANRQQVLRDAAVLEATGVRLPEIIQQLTSDARESTISGIELEFARRVCEHHARRLSRKAAAAPKE